MKKSIIETFFNSWSENSSYLLGYICADGCIHKRKGRDKSFILSITSKDKEHLENINRILGSNYSISKKTNGMNGSAFNIAISNYKFCLSVINRGILPQKTLSLKPIVIPDEYFKDFVRGFFDADGSAYIYFVNGTPQLKAEFVCASKIFIEFLSRKLSKILNIGDKSIHRFIRKDRINPIYSIAFYINDGQKLGDLMYGHKPKLYLERKFQIFEQWKTIKRRKYVIKKSLAIAR